MLNGGKFLKNHTNHNNNDIYTTTDLLEKKYPDHDFKWHNNHSGTKVTGLCPIHGDRHSSLSVHIWHNIPYYNCFACDFKGNLYDLTGKQRKFTPEEKERYEKQIKAAELAEQFKQNLIDSNGIAKRYLRKRFGVNNEIITKLISATGNIGLIPKGYKAPNDFGLLEYTAKSSEQLVFIYTNPSGLITQFHLRCPETKEFRTFKITDSGVLNANYIINPLAQSPIIWIVEGEFDALTPLANMIDGKENTAENIIAIGSTNNLNAKFISYIIRHDRIPVIAMDWDRAGRQAIIGLIDDAKRAKIDLNKIWTVPKSPGYNVKDFDELFAGRQFDELKYIEKGVTPIFFISSKASSVQVTL